MNRWVSFFCALSLVLVLWTGGAAHAAERFDCLPVASQAVSNFEGDRDQVPSRPDQGVAHHHSGCSHHVAAAANSVVVELSFTTAQGALFLNETGPPSRVPDHDLRPPIA